jgi:hypothetical protein
MKLFNSSLMKSVLSLVVPIFLFSCKKESNTVSLPGSSSELSQSVDATGITTLLIKPGPNNGQDTYVSKIDDNPDDGNVNQNWTHEIAIGKWLEYYSQSPATWRGYIKFDSLSRVPSTSKIISAKLYLYGESSSLTFPYGNSYYDGSSNPENSVLVQRVTGGNWSQSTLTWNTMPATTAKYQDTIAASSTEWNYNTVTDVTKLVQAMVTTGNNFGFCLRMVTEELPRSMVFSTSESADKSLRPKLVVVYR